MTTENNTLESSEKAVLSDALVLPLRVIDLASPFFFGVGRDMTDEERTNAERHGRYDNPPMSVLGVTSDGLAAVEGEDMAQLFATSPKLLDALRKLLPIAVDLIDKANERGEIEWPSGNISEVIHAQAAINEALGQNADGDGRRDGSPKSPAS